MGQAYLSALQVTLGGFFADLVNEGSERYAFVGKPALQRFRVHVELGGDHLHRCSAGRKELPHDYANGLPESGFGCGDGVEVLNKGSVGGVITAQGTTKICRTDRETRCPLGEVGRATEVGDVVRQRRQTIVREVYRKRRSVRSQQEPQHPQ